MFQDDAVIFLSGVGKEMGDWKIDAPLVLTKEGNWWTIKIDLSKVTYPIAYKYGLYNIKEQKFLAFEAGVNRTLPASGIKKSKLTIIHDGFVQLAFPNWKGAGVAIPVFSLRSTSGFGTGEFCDIKLLVDWAKACWFKSDPASSC